MKSKKIFIFVFIVLQFLCFNSCNVENAVRAISLEIDTSDPFIRTVTWATHENNVLTLFSFEERDNIGELMILRADTNVITKNAIFLSSTGNRKNAVYFIVDGIKYYYIPGSSQNIAMPSSSSPFVDTISEFSYFDDLDLITTMTNDIDNYSVFVEVSLAYDKDNSEYLAEFTNRKIDIQDFLYRYFSEKSALELRPENEEQMKREIMELINTRLLDIAKIRRIIFLRFDVFEVD